MEEQAHGRLSPVVQSAANGVGRILEEHRLAVQGSSSVATHGGDKDHSHASLSNLEARRQMPTHKSGGHGPNLVEDVAKSGGEWADPVDSGQIQWRSSSVAPVG